MKKLIVIFICLAFLSGCASTQKAEMTQLDKQIEAYENRPEVVEKRNSDRLSKFIDIILETVSMGLAFGHY